MTEKETETQTSEACFVKKGCPLCACVHAVVTRRVVARLTDYVVWGILSLLTLYGVVRYTVMTDSAVLKAFFSLPYSLHLFLYIAFIVYVFVEALLISLCGKTLGKALTGLTVSDENGEKLTFKKSLYRAWLVFFKGMGLFLPLISVFVPLFRLFRYRKTKEFVWDVESKTKPEAGPFRVVFKIVLVLFYGFLAFGVYSAHRNANEFPNIPSEEKILYSYLQAIEPYLKNSLEETSLLTPDKVDSTLENLQKAKEITEKYQTKYLETEKKFMEKTEKVSNPKAKEFFEASFAAQKKRVMGFFFLQQIRLSLFENIVSFFKSSEGQYTFENGRPVFTSPELTERYEEYMRQMTDFVNDIALEADGTEASDDEITVDDIIAENESADGEEEEISEEEVLEEEPEPAAE